MEEATKFGLMAVSTKATGRKTWPMAEEDSFTLMEISTRATGEMTRLTATDNTLTQTEPSTRAVGWTINSMDKGRNTGQMVLSMKAITKWVRKMDMGSSFGLTNLHTVDSSSIIIFMVTAGTGGQTVENTAETGCVTKCMEQVCLLGLTAESMKDNIMMIKSTDMESSHGQIIDNMMGSG